MPKQCFIIITLKHSWKRIFQDDEDYKFIHKMARESRGEERKRREELVQYAESKDHVKVVMVTSTSKYCSACSFPLLTIYFVSMYYTSQPSWHPPTRLWSTTTRRQTLLYSKKTRPNFRKLKLSKSDFTSSNFTLEQKSDTHRSCGLNLALPAQRMNEWIWCIAFRRC